MTIRSFSSKRFGTDLRLAHEINVRIFRWGHAKWDQRMALLKLLSPDQFAEALKTNLRGRWLWRFTATHLRSSRRVILTNVSSQ